MLDTMQGVWTEDPIKPKAWDLADVREGRWPEPRPRHIQPKHDGWRIDCFMQDDPSNGLCVFGRKREAHLELSHLLDRYDWYRRLERRMPAHSCVTGELYMPGSPASSVITAMKAGDPALTFTPFAVPWWVGAPYVGTMGDARYLVKEMGLDFVVDLPFLEHDEEDLRSLFPDAEGVVLKHGHLDGWWKVKWEITVDAVVMAVLTGDPYGKYPRVGSLEVGQYEDDGALVGIAAVSGMTDEVREAVTAADVGRVCEIRYQYVGAGGRARHPRFVRWRDDKPARECVKERAACARTCL